MVLSCGFRRNCFSQPQVDRFTVSFSGIAEEGQARVHLHALFLATAHSGQMNVCEVFCGWYSPSDTQTSLFAAVHRNIGDLHDSDVVLCRVCESVLARVLLE